MRIGTLARTDSWLVIDDVAGDPFAQLEDFLTRHGFGVWDEPFVPAADGLVADLFLGYRLASALPGVTEPQPPEPCPLPALACRVRPAEGQRRAVPGRFTTGRFEPTWTAAQHRAAIEAVREAIARGDVYQANIVQHLSAPFGGDVAAVEAALAPLGAEHGGAMHGDGWSIVSATPELFLRRRGDVVETMPIKGTRPASSTERIADDPKDRAEHVMIVDLERNDLARVCVPHSVHVPDLLVERPMAGVRHLVSRVQGRLRLAVGLGELLRATFPGGSITGAPKVVGDQPHRPPRAGRPRRLDGGAGPHLPERGHRPGPDDPHVRGRRRSHPPMGRRRHRLGLRSGGGGGGVAGQGPAAPVAARLAA